MGDEHTDKPSDKNDVIRRIQDGRVAFDRAIGSIGPERLSAELSEGEWIIRDLLHHISAWERLMVKWIEESIRGETPDRPAPHEEWGDLDALNAQIVAEGHALSEEQILSNFVDSYHAAIEIVKRMSDDDLFDGDRFAWRKGEPIWYLVAANTWWHYQEHSEQITSADTN
jgi:hypothetical protein